MSKRNDQGDGTRFAGPEGPAPMSRTPTSDEDAPARSAPSGGSAPFSADDEVGSTAPTDRRPKEPAGPTLVDQVREEARNLASDAKDQTAEVVGQATRQVSSLITDQKERAADRLGSLAGALRKAAQTLGHDELGSRVEHYAKRAAEQVDSMSDYVRQTELQTFVHDTGQFARRRPEVFIGTAFLTGLFAARFLKASGANARQPQRPIGGR